MKKPLMLFIVGVVVLLIAVVAYNRYCKNKPGGCKKVSQQESKKVGEPKEGIDW